MWVNLSEIHILSVLGVGVLDGSTVAEGVSPITAYKEPKLYQAKS